MRSISFKRNKFLILSFIIMFIIIFTSFFQYFHEYYSYTGRYYEIKEKCYEKKTAASICSMFNKEYSVEKYLEVFDPIKKFNNLDAITLTCEIVENTIFSILQFLSPLIIILAVVGTIHSEINSGYFKNYLMRMNYKEYIRKNLIKVLKVSFIMPISLLLIFTISCLITKFNFSISESVYRLSVYDEWKYNHFFQYGITICIVQFLMSFTYGLIAMNYSFKNKNFIISCLFSYIIFIIEVLFVYIIIYNLIINKIFGIKEMSEYFNIAGFWFFEQKINYFILLIIVVSIAVINYLFTIFKLKNKERVVINNEKQIA